jgi:hypothetical protein
MPEKKPSVQEFEHRVTIIAHSSKWCSRFIAHQKEKPQGARGKVCCWGI